MALTPRSSRACHSPLFLLPLLLLLSASPPLAPPAQARRLPHTPCASYPNSALSNDAGGRVLANGPLNVYTIFYGDWSSSPCAQGTYSNLLMALMASPDGIGWWKVVTKYCDSSSGRFVNSTLNILGFVQDSSTQTSFASEEDVWQIVQSNLKNGGLVNSMAPAYTPGPDANGLYIVLLSPSVTVSGSSSCEWNAAKVYSRRNKVAYAVVPQPTSSNGCGSGKTSYNSCPVIDNVAPYILHVLAEGATNPFGDGWRSAAGLGIADTCTSTSSLFKLTGSSGYAFNAPQIYDPQAAQCVTSA